MCYASRNNKNPVGAAVVIFCIFYELFSGTNPYEAVATAYGYLNYIGKHSNIRFMLTTNYIRLCKLFNKTKNIENINIGTKLINDVPQYSYKIVLDVGQKVLGKTLK